MLRGLTPKFGSFDDVGFDGERFERQVEGEPSFAIAACLYWIRKLQARVFANDYAAAIAAGPKQNASSGCRQLSSSARNTISTTRCAGRDLRRGPGGGARLFTARRWQPTTVPSRSGPRTARRTLRTAQRWS